MKKGASNIALFSYPYSKPKTTTGGHGVILYTEMEINLETLISLLGLLLGGGSIGGLVTWQYARRKAKAEADTAVAESKQKEAEAERARFEAVQAAMSATKEVQDSYQELLEDMKNDRTEQRSYIEEQKRYIMELKEDRIHLRKERDELRDRQDHLEQTVRDLQEKVARNGRAVESLRPFMCIKKHCPDRIIGVLTEAGEVVEQ